MTEKLIADGAAVQGVALPPGAASLLAAYAGLLLRANEDMNLTGAATEAEVFGRHILDSLCVIPLLSPGVKSVLDVGSGAGFPGLVMAAAMPDVRFTLLDAREKRVDFLRRTALELGLRNVECLCGRAEELAAAAPLRESFDCAVSRAVARMSMLAELCVPFIRKGGGFYAMKAADCADETAEAAAALEKLGCAPAETLFYECAGVRRALVRAKKSRATPPLYPRRFAKIQKNPL